MKPIKFSQHAQEQMAERGAAEEEVVEAIRTGKEYQLNGVVKDIGRTFSMTVYGLVVLMLSNKF